MPTARSRVLHMPSLMQHDFMQVFLTNINFQFGKKRGLTSGWSKKNANQNPRHTLWAQKVNGLTLYKLLGGSLFFFLVINRD